MAAFAGCGSSSKKISDQTHRDIVAGCSSTGQPQAGCECIYQQLTTKQGVDTEAKLKSLSDKITAAVKTANPGAAVPAGYRAAVLACRGSLKKGP